MNHLRMTAYCALAAMPMALATSASASIVIDDFTGPDQAVANDGLTDNSQLDVGAVLGGERDLNVLSGTGILGTTSTVSDGVFNFSNSPTSQGSMNLVYDGNDSSIAVDQDGLGGIDLTDGGSADAFAFTLLFADFEVQYTVSISDTSFNTASFTGTLPTDILNSGDAVDIIIPFASLIGSGDIADVGSFGLVFNAQEPAADIVIDNFRTVPEPTSVALLLAGGALLARRRRRD